MTPSESRDRAALSETTPKHVSISDEHDHDHHNNEHVFHLKEAARIVFVALAAAAVWFRVWEPFPSVSVIGIVGVLVGGWPVFREAVENMLARRMTMELSMSIALIAAVAIGEFFTALIITSFVLVAEVLEGMTVARGRSAIRDLLDFLPRTATVRRADGVAEIDVAELVAGDAILVNPGGRVPVDGMVVDGHSFLDQSRITGESMPVEAITGSSVFAGSINQSGAIEIRAERLGRDTSYGKIIEVVEQSERSRAPVQRLADQLAGYLVYFALAAAALTWLITRDMRSTISVVIVAGACGIAAGTPLAILGAIGRAARLGAIIKGGLFLETLGRVDTVVIDKTGTLTFGRPEVQHVMPVEGIDVVVLLSVAATAEIRSEHPLGKAIIEYAQAQGCIVIEPDLFDYTPGRGIAAVTNGSVLLVGNRLLMVDHGVDIAPKFASFSVATSEVFIARDGTLLGAIAVADKVRPEARAAMDALKGLHIRTLILTGDAEPVARAVAKQVGITEFEANLLPEDKHERVRALVSAKCTVAMLGDGINDAPALAAANVGVAMGSGTDVARESANIVLLGNDLSRFVDTLVIAQRTRKIIWANFIGTIAVDVIGVGLAAFGILNPLGAAFIHVASELVFILNSARLLPSADRHALARPVLPTSLEH
ncbi:cadmium-translocating P-type ATPase [Allopusillimonas ginsengisoli]|nr:cadmium-translocating P-type ATPase [Allopusillimonas ginsengisoli]